MNRRSLCPVIVLAATLTLGGCVAKSEFLQKTAENEALNRRLEASAAENNALHQQLGRLAAEKEALNAEKKRLTAEGQDLREQLTAKSEEMARAVQSFNNRTAELEGDAQMLRESIDLLKKTKEEAIKTVSSTYENLLTEMKEEIEQGQIAITELQGKLTVDVVDKILFDSGQAEVKQQGLEILKRVVEILKTVTDKTIRIEGHTDNVTIAGALAKRYPTNWELSAARAINVTRYLAKEGLDPTLLSAAAYGEYRPIADNETPDGRAKNRRIAIILLPME